jgi:DNA-binding NarL/FixJ family response regulator
MQATNKVKSYLTFLDGRNLKDFTDFFRVANEEMEVIRSLVRTARMAEAVLKNNFDFVKNDTDKHHLIQLCSKFPEIKTPRQLEIAFYCIKGMSEKQMAARLFRTVKNVKYLKTKVYKSAGVKSQAELMAFYFGSNYRPDTEHILPVGNNE